MDDAITDVVLDRWARRVHCERASARDMRALAHEVADHIGHQPCVSALLRAAKDEADHANLCLAVLHRLGGTLEPSPVELKLPPAFSRTPIVRTAERIVFFLCAGEAIAASVIDDAASFVRDAEIRSVLDRIANDERRHGRVGWEVLDALLAVCTPAERQDLAHHAPRQAVRAAFASERSAPATTGAGEGAWGVQSGTRAGEIAREVVLKHVAPRLAKRGLWAPPGAVAGAKGGRR